LMCFGLAVLLIEVVGRLWPASSKHLGLSKARHKEILLELL
jgi:hypothetical protein